MWKIRVQLLSHHSDLYGLLSVPPTDESVIVQHPVKVIQFHFNPIDLIFPLTKTDQL